MSVLFVADIRRFTLERLEDSLAAKGLGADDVRNDFDLLAEGVIDSLGIVELFAALEERFGVEIDFEDLDADHLTVVGHFCQYIAEKATRAHDRSKGLETN